MFLLLLDKVMLLGTSLYDETVIFPVLMFQLQIIEVI